MRLVRYNPFNDPTFWGSSFNDFFKDTQARDNTPWSPVVDILNKKDHVVLNMELPGMKKEEISINIKDRVLTIKGDKKIENEDKKDHYYRKERVYGCFKRSFTLSEDVRIDDVSADFKDGVLTLTLKKDTTKEEVRQITIN